MNESQRWWSATLVVLAVLSAAALSQLLARDERATGAHKIMGWLAIGIACSPLGVHALIRRPAAVAQLLALGGMVAVSAMTYQIGGLGYLVSGVFLLAGAATTLLARHARPPGAPIAPSTGRVLFAFVILLMVASLFSLGGASIVVIPVGIPLLFWARSLRRPA